MQDKDFTIRKKKSRKEVELAANRGSLTVVTSGKATLTQQGLAENRGHLVKSRESIAAQSLSRVSSREYSKSINQGGNPNHKLRLKNITNNHHL